MAWSNDIVQLTSDVAQIKTSVNNKKTALNNAVSSANTSSIFAANSAVLAASSAAAALTHAATANTAKEGTLSVYPTLAVQQSTVATAQTNATVIGQTATTASAALPQDLSGINTAALHRSPNAITSMFVYDTSKDTDGGAWTEKCQHTSWYNETLSGRWLGANGSETLARFSNATLGNELITNGSFSNGSTGWALNGFTVINGVAVSNANSIGLSQNVTTTAGKLYRVEYDVSLSASATTSIIRLNSAGNLASTTIGAGGFRRITEYVVAGSGTTGLEIITTAGTNIFSLDNISVREVLSVNTISNDYFQFSPDGRFYRLWKNLLSRSEEFDNAYWLRASNSVTINAPDSPFGGATSEGIIPNAGVNSSVLVYRNNLTVVAGQPYTFSVYAKKGSLGNFLELSLETLFPGSSAAVFNLNDGTISVQGAGLVSAITQNVGNGWYRCSVTAIPTTSGNSGFAYYLPRTSSSTRNVTGDGVSVLTYLWGAQLELGSTATTYEAKGADGTNTEVFRGNKRDFPRLAGIVAEATNVTIYDLTEPGRPMWMRFVRTTNQGRSFLPDQANITAVSSYNGLLCIGSTSATQAGISGVDFCKDVLWRYDNLADRSGYGGFNIAQRAIATLLDNITTTIVNRSVNAIAMTVLPDAPTDPATGLRVPTIAVATAGGISLIRHDGVVRNSSLTTGFEDIDINPYMLSVSDNASSTWFYAKNPGSLGASFTMLTVPATAGPTFGTSAIQSFRRKARAEYVRRGGARVNLLRLNEDVSGRSISADMTNTYNTGWLTGDIRRCYLSDATTGTPIGGQLIVNGGFDIDASGWSGDGSFSVSNGELTWVVGTIYHKIWQAINVVPGTRYLVSYKRVSGTGTFELRVGTSALTNNVATASHVAIGAFYLSFTATTSVVYVGIQANNLGTYVLDDFSVTAIVDDRSYKAALSTITGTLTKSQLASGTSLIAYSGWSNSNYLREPYSTDLDFGTGEFNASAWMNIPATLPALSTVTTLSANQITNGTFASGLTGWSVSNANGTTNVISVSGGKAVYSTVGGTTLTLSQSCGLIGGRSYKITFDVSNYNGPDKIRVRFGTNAVVADINANGPVTLYYTYASSTGDYISFINSVNQALSFEIDNIVVQEILPYSIIDRSHSSGPRFTLALTPGGYLTATAFDGVTTRIVTTSATYNTAQWLKADVNYTTDGSLAISVNGREVVATRGTPLGNMTLGKNLIPFSESFDNSTWIKSNSTVTANVSTAPDGTLTADKLIANTGSVAAQTNQLIATTAISYGFSVYAKAAEFSQIQLSNDGITSTAFFDLSAGTIGATVGATASITSVGNGWYRCGIVFTNIAGTPRHRIYVANGGSTTVTGNGVNGVLIWGAQLETGASITSYAATNVAPLTIGNSFALNTPFPGSIALLKLSATVPTPEQTTFMYEQEKQLFRPGAQSILPDSGSIVDMAYDDATDRWVAVSASNESYWTGLVRNSVTAVPTGSYSRVASASGVELTSRSTLNTGVDVTIPPYGLREEIVKKSESASRLSRQIATYDYVGGFTGNITTGSTAIASVTNLTYPTSYIGARISGTGIPTNATITGVSGTTIYISAPATATTTGLTISFLDFILPVGQEAKIVMSAGTIRREGSTADYTRLYDGFRETIRFATAPGTTAWVQIQSTRIPQ